MGANATDRPSAGAAVTAAACICYLFLLVPTLIIIPLSFGNSAEFEFPPRSWSLTLYRQLFSDPTWRGPLIQSLAVALATTVLSLLIAVPAAYGLRRANFPGKRLLAVLFVSPMLVPTVVLGLGLYLEYAVLGLADTNIGLLLSHLMLVAPFVIVIVSLALDHADPALEQAALVMGATQGRVFFQVVLPQIVPSLFAAASFAFLLSLDEVIVAYFVTGPGTMTLPVKMYSAIRWELSPVIAAVSTLLTMLAAVMAFAIMQFQRGRHVEQG